MVTCPACDGERVNPHSIPIQFFRGRLVHIDTSCPCCYGHGLVTESHREGFEKAGIAISKELDS